MIKPEIPTPAPESFNQPILLLDPDRLKPLPKDLWDMPCSSCQRVEAKWAFMPSVPPPGAENAATEPEPYTLCSLCFLYLSEWGKRRRGEIDKMVAAVEKELTDRELDEAARKGTLPPEKFAEIKVEFPKDEDGKMMSNRDANRILGAIAVSSRMFVSKLETAEAIQSKIDEQRIVLPDGLQFGPPKTK